MQVLLVRSIVLHASDLTLIVSVLLDVLEPRLFCCFNPLHRCRHESSLELAHEGVQGDSVQQPCCHFMIVMLVNTMQGCT